MAASTSHPISGRIHHQFGVKRRLGQALYGSVYLCEDLHTNATVSTTTDNANNNSSNTSTSSNLVAIKQVNLRDAKRRLSVNPNMDNPWQERKNAQQLTVIGPHPHVLSFRGNFIENGAWYIVMDYCDGGDLLSMLHDQPDGRCDEYKALKYFRQIAEGVKHLHGHGIAHRDLSLENVLLHGDVCKLSDFGLSTEADRVCTERVGKAYYMAPEVVAAETYDAKAADMWSLGIMLFILLTGSPLVEIASSTDKSFMALRAFGVENILDAWGMASEVNAKTLVLLRRLLCMDPRKRATIDDVLVELPRAKP